MRFSLARTRSQRDKKNTLFFLLRPALCFMSIFIQNAKMPQFFLLTRKCLFRNANPRYKKKIIHFYRKKLRKAETVNKQILSFRGFGWREIRQTYKRCKIQCSRFIIFHRTWRNIEITNLCVFFFCWFRPSCRRTCNSCRNELAPRRNSSRD